MPFFNVKQAVNISSAYGQRNRDPSFLYTKACSKVGVGQCRNA